MFIARALFHAVAIPWVETHYIKAGKRASQRRTPVDCAFSSGLDIQRGDGFINQRIYSGRSVTGVTALVAVYLLACGLSVRCLYVIMLASSPLSRGSSTFTYITTYFNNGFRGEEDFSAVNQTRKARGKDFPKG